MTAVNTDPFNIQPCRLVRLLNAFHALFLVVFLFVVALSAGRASAGEGDCPGKDLRASLAADHPDIMTDIRDEASETPNAKGIFWRIERQGTPPSFLYGTMHSTDPRVNEISKAAGTAFAGADTVVVEAKDVLADQQKMAALLFGNPDLTMLPDGKTLDEFLDDEQKETVTAVLEARNVPLSTVQRMRPWLVMTMLSLPECELARSRSGTVFLDKKLATEALSEGKELAGLETGEEQFEAMNGIPLDKQVELLVGSAALYHILPDMFETMTALYLDGEIGMIMPTLDAIGKLNGESEDDLEALFQQFLIVDRNRTMAERVMPILADGNAFVAVGALHLPGEDGLIELLRKAGYTVTAAE